MSDRTEHPTAPAGAAAPLDPLEFLGAPPLVPGEYQEDYDALLTRINGALNPADILEQIWIRDIADLVWEVFRLRRLKASLMTHSARGAMRRELYGKFGKKAGELALKWAADDEAAGKTVDAALTAAGVTVDGVVGDDISRKFSELERIERMIAGAEARRHRALCELDRHRATVSQRLRGALSEIEAAASPNGRKAAAQKPSS